MIREIVTVREVLEMPFGNRTFPAALAGIDAQFESRVARRVFRR